MSEREREREKGRDGGTLCRESISFGTDEGEEIVF